MNNNSSTTLSDYISFLRELRVLIHCEMDQDPAISPRQYADIWTAIDLSYDLLLQDKYYVTAEEEKIIEDCFCRFYGVGNG
jgi:hypothetical protein